jgi:multiple sugar transport system ATP-binding protein
MTQISLRGLHKSFGAVHVVRDLNLEIADREFLVLLGPSGCGKTTTMRMVAGLEQATHGEIAFDGRRVNEVPTRARDVAMVFQNYGLYPHMSVADNIGYPLKLRGLSRQDRDAAVRRAAARVELEPYLDRRPRELSGGQRQRVALARSIVRTPRVFLMDEPLSNLDAKLRVAMRAEIKHLAHELQVTTLYVTHDQVEAMTLAHRVAIMKDGVIRQLAAPEQIYDDPADAYVAGFIGSPPMNLIPVHAEGHEVRTESGVRLAVAPPRAGRLLMGARAEDIVLASDRAALVDAEVFAFELLGDSTQVTVKFGHTPVALKGERSLRLAMGDRIGLRVRPERVYWFDADNGQRIRTEAHTQPTTDRSKNS